jgi:hypothetical protein
MTFVVAGRFSLDATFALGAPQEVTLTSVSAEDTFLARYSVP